VVQAGKQQQSAYSDIPAGATVVHDPTQHHNPEYYPQLNTTPVQPQAASSLPTPLRFLKGAGKTYLDSTLNAGPQMGFLQPVTDKDMQAAANRGVRQTLKDSWNAVDLSPSSVLHHIGSSLFSTVEDQASQAMSSPEGAGSAAMTLLMLRQGLKGKSIPEIGSPHPYAEIVEPLSGGKIIGPPNRLPPGPIVTPPAADSSGSVPFKPPLFSNTTRAQRLGLMLPERTPAPIQLGEGEIVPPEPGGVFPAARHVDPSTGRVQFLTSRAADLPEGPQPGAELIKQPVNAPLIAGPPSVSANLEIPRTNSGEGVLNQALTALDNKSLLKVARSRGIDVTKEAQLKAGKADATVVRKILDSFSEDELDEARNIGIEVSRNRPVQADGITPEAGKEAWHYKVLNTFFPDVSIPKSMTARAQATIGKRPGMMMNAAEKSAIEQANAAGRPTLPPDESPAPGLMAKAKKRSGGGSAPAQATPAAQQPPVQPAEVQPQLATEANTEDLLRKSLEMQQAKKGPGLMANVPKEAPVENRGQYPDLRAEVDKMSPEDRHRAIFISDKTELPNRRAFDIAEGHGQVKAYAMSDADGLKALNDKFGYGAGDALLKAKADALREAGLEAYHDKGDEFLYRGESAADLKAKLEHANEILKNKEIQVETGDGKVLKFKGAEFSHGEAENLGTAEAGLKTDKAAREAAGKRKRGELGGIKKID
jgi:GGDEF domain-containing protein